MLNEQSDGSYALLERACPIFGGLEAEGARLLRMGSNAVYRLIAPVIVRISRPGADVERAQNRCCRQMARVC